MNRKGFTLIEVLGAIVVLGLLGVIIIPKINSTLINSKINTYMLSVQGIVDSFDAYFIDLKTTMVPFEGCEYNFDTNSTTCIDFEYSGKNPDGGNVTIDSDGNINGNVVFNDYYFSIVNGVITRDES